MIVCIIPLVWLGLVLWPINQNEEKREKKSREEKYPNWIDLEGCLNTEYAFIDYFSAFILVYRLNN